MTAKTVFEIETFKLSIFLVVEPIKRAIHITVCLCGFTHPPEAAA